MSTLGEYSTNLIEFPKIVGWRGSPPVSSSSWASVGGGRARSAQWRAAVSAVVGVAMVCAPESGGARGGAGTSPCAWRWMQQPPVLAHTVGLTAHSRPRRRRVCGTRPYGVLNRTLDGRAVPSVGLGPSMRAGRQVRGRQVRGRVARRSVLAPRVTAGKRKAPPGWVQIPDARRRIAAPEIEAPAGHRDGWRW